jgi:hypothetical protein
MNAIKKYIMLVMLAVLTSGFGLQAQNGLKIKKIFDDYSTGKGVVMVQLTNETMDGFDFSLYKSILIKDNPVLVDLVQKSIEIDEAKATKVKKMESGNGNERKNTTFLLLPKHNNLFRLILYKNECNKKAEQTVLLIYIETTSKPDDMLNFILKKK